jgi:hypothetical protein
VSLINRLLISVLVLQSPLCAQEMGVVSFYSPTFPVKDQLKTSVSPITHIPLRGKLFDGDRRVADFTPGRFLTLNVPAGVHVFSVGLRHPQSDASLSLVVKAGERSCVRLTEKYLNLIVIPTGFVTGFVEEVNCNDAKKETEGSKAIETKHVATDVLPLLSKSSF